MSICKQKFLIKENRAGENNKFFIDKKIYDGYEIQRQVMNVATRLRGSILGHLFCNQLLNRLHESPTPQGAIGEWGNDVSPCKKEK